MQTDYAQCGIPRKGEFRAPGLRRIAFQAESRPMPPKSSSLSEAALAAQAQLRAWRKSRNLTLEALAEQMGSKVSTLSGWETGKRAVDMEDLHRLAAFYGVHPAALLMHPDEAGPAVERMKRASSLAERMSEKDADQWLSIGESLADRR